MVLRPLIFCSHHPVLDVSVLISESRFIILTQLYCPIVSACYYCSSWLKNAFFRPCALGTRPLLNYSLQDTLKEILIAAALHPETQVLPQPSMLFHRFPIWCC